MSEKKETKMRKYTWTVEEGQPPRTVERTLKACEIIAGSDGQYDVLHGMRDIEDRDLPHIVDMLSYNTMARVNGLLTDLEFRDKRIAALEVENLERAVQHARDVEGIKNAVARAETNERNTKAAELELQGTQEDLDSATRLAESHKAERAKLALDLAALAGGRPVKTMVAAAVEQKIKKVTERAEKAEVQHKTDEDFIRTILLERDHAQQVEVPDALQRLATAEARVKELEVEIRHLNRGMEKQAAKNSEARGILAAGNIKARKEALQAKADCDATNADLKNAEDGNAVLRRIIVYMRTAVGEVLRLWKDGRISWSRHNAEHENKQCADVFDALDRSLSASAATGDAPGTLMKPPSVDVAAEASLAAHETFVDAFNAWWQTDDPTSAETVFSGQLWEAVKSAHEALTPRPGQGEKRRPTVYRFGVVKPAGESWKTQDGIVLEIPRECVAILKCDLDAIARVVAVMPEEEPNSRWTLHCYGEMLAPNETVPGKSQPTPSVEPATPANTPSQPRRAQANCGSNTCTAPAEVCDRCVEQDHWTDKPREQDEEGWMIEVKGPRWLSVDSHRFGFGGSDAGLRFSSKYQAWCMIHALRFHLPGLLPEGASPTFHLWSPPPQRDKLPPAPDSNPSREALNNEAAGIAHRLMDGRVWEVTHVEVQTLAKAYLHAKSFVDAVCSVADEKPLPSPAACKPCVGEDGWTLKKTCTHHPTRCGGFHCNVCRCYEPKTCKTCGNGSPDGYVCRKSVGRECADTGTRQHWIPREQPLPAPAAAPKPLCTACWHHHVHCDGTSGGVPGPCGDWRARPAPAAKPAVSLPAAIQSPPVKSFPKPTNCTCMEIPKAGDDHEYGCPCNRIVLAAKPVAEPDDCQAGGLGMSVEQTKKRYRKPANVRSRLGAVRPSDVDNQLVERVAATIYRHQGGITDDECISVYGKPRRAWKTDAPWDSNPMELSEHERDEYRMQARAALAVMRAEMIPAPAASVAAQRVLDAAVNFEQFETTYKGLIEVASIDQRLVQIAQRMLRDLFSAVRSFNAGKVKP